MKLSQTQCPTTSEDREKMKGVPYASAIGSIMYAMLCTRPDVCLAISLARRYQSNPGLDHWTAVKNILKYLKRTKDMFLVYGGVIRLQRIYNFDFSMLLYYLFWMLMVFILHFYIIFGTNLLTGGPSRIAVFCLCYKV